MVRPLLHATFLLDRSLYGNSPTGYHLLNLMLHFASTVLVYRILTVAVAEESRAIALWTAVVFFIHPIATETVTYISGRASGLMAFFYLLAFFLYIEASKRHENGPARRLYLAGAVVSHLFSFGSKETAMTFPLVLLLWDVVIRRHDAVSLRRSVSHQSSSVLDRAVGGRKLGMEASALCDSCRIQLHLAPLMGQLSERNPRGRLRRCSVLLSLEAEFRP